jgi:hypothetical protein
MDERKRERERERERKERYIKERGREIEREVRHRYKSKRTSCDDRDCNWACCPWKLRQDVKDAMEQEPAHIIAKTSANKKLWPLTYRNISNTSRQTAQTALTSLPKKTLTLDVNVWQALKIRQPLPRRGIRL